MMTRGSEPAESHAHNHMQLAMTTMPEHQPAADVNSPSVGNQTENKTNENDQRMGTGSESSTKGVSSMATSSNEVGSRVSSMATSSNEVGSSSSPPVSADATVMGNPETYSSSSMEMSSNKVGSSSSLPVSIDVEVNKGCETRAEASSNNSMETSNNEMGSSSSPPVSADDAVNKRQEGASECPWSPTRTVVQLCAGGGGIALAERMLGYAPLALIEEDPRCARTLAANGFDNVINARIQDIDFKQFRGATLLSAGLPCQPWSAAGRQAGADDHRNLWDEAVRAVREIEPQLVFFEMVPGFLRPAFEHVRKEVADALLELGMQPQWHTTDAQDVRLAQSRRRCILTAVRNGLPTVTPPPVQRGRTVRELLDQLGPPNGTDRHDLHPGAREYKGHLASAMDAPAHTVVAGTHGPGGGCNVVKLDDGSVRYFSIREMASLQGFPPNYVFDPSWSRAVREIGNACPPPMALAWLGQLSRSLTAGRAANEGVARTPRAAHPAPQAQDEGVATRHVGCSEAPEHEGVPLQPDAVSPDTSPVAQDPGDDSLPGGTAPKVPWQGLAEELSRRDTLLRIMSAQVAVVSGQCRDAVVELVKTDDNAQMASVVGRLRQAAADVSPQECTERTAMLAAVAQSVEQYLPARQTASQPTVVTTARAGAEQVLRVASAGSWRVPRCRTTPIMPLEEALPPVAGSVIARADALGGLLDKLSNERRARQTAHLEYRFARREAYFAKLDKHVREPDALPRTNPSGESILFKMPRKWLDQSQHEAPDPAPGKVRDFFHVPTTGLADEDDEEIKYQSMKATLPLGDGTGTTCGVESIVDSGAAWCGIKFEVLKRRFPSLVSRVAPSKIRFRDASGNAMNLAGKVRMTVQLGRATLTTTVFVFNALSADFLLGTNALRRNRCVIDCNLNRLYVAGEPRDGVPLRSVPGDSCDLATVDVEDDALPDNPTDDGMDGPVRYRVECDADSCRLVVVGEDGSSAHVPCVRPGRIERSRLVLDADVTIEPGKPAVLDPVLVSPLGEHPLATLELTATAALKASGLQYVENAFQNPTEARGLVKVKNDTDAAITLHAGMCVAIQVPACAEDDDLVTIAAVLEPREEVAAASEPDTLQVTPESIEFLRSRGFSLDKAIDPDLRGEDGQYAPLSDEKKRRLYEVALRWHYVWSVNPKAPKISLLVVLDIPTGDASPVAQAPYSIPAKLRDAAMKEINGLLEAGLIEPSMSDWCSPALVRVKKDSELDEYGNPTKIKFAIDYRRVNALTKADVGGLGNQSDIINSLGGNYKFIGLCDAAGGYYQCLLSPEARAKSAFILPASMGGTLFQWRVAPYGLTRNPAGYSRGMQWTLKGMNDLRDLDVGSARGGAMSWLDDICMRANTFDGFVDLFDRVLERLAVSQNTLKGSKCELLRAEMDVLGFVSTPHGLMLQKPKLAKIMQDGIPRRPGEAKTFLGAVAFLRRMVPRISLLAAPMTAAVKSYEKRNAESKGARLARRRNQGTRPAFAPAEQEYVNQSWHAIIEHLDGDSVIVPPDFDDPLAHYAICTDASDFAVGGVLMQWQRSSGPVPSTAPPPTPKGEDPLDSKWRKANGYKLVVLGYYSKTLTESQRNYAIFDKEAGALLLCVRQWSDLITYHPTTVYTDSAVATSMLTKHAAPPRLQRWGLELGAYLPHLKIAFRKGEDNGLADLLSRYPAFENFTKARASTVELPDDLFEKMGEAPYFNPSIHKHNRRDFMDSHVFELYDLKTRQAVQEPIWNTPGASEIPGRGSTDQPQPSVDEDATGVWLADVAAATATNDADEDAQADLDAIVADLIDHKHGKDRERAGEVERVLAQFLHLHDRPLTVHVYPRDAATIADWLEPLGCEVVVTTEPGSPADIRVTDRHWQGVGDYETIQLSKDIHLGPGIHLGGTSLGIRTSCEAERKPICRGSCYAPPGALFDALSCVTRELVLRRFGISLEREHVAGDRSADALEATGTPPMPETSLTTLTVETDETGAEVAPTTTSPHRTFQWQEGHIDAPASRPIAECDFEPTAMIALPEQLRDPRLRMIVHALRGDRRHPKSTVARLSDRYELKDDALYYHTIKDGEPGYALVVPEFARASILSRFHFSLGEGAGHAGGQTMYDQIRRDYYWYGMETECHAFAAACEHCGSTRSQANIGAPAGVSPTPTRPFEVIHVDHKSVSMCDGFTAVLAVVCALTKFTLYIPVKRQTGEETLRVLMSQVFAVFGCPLVIISDNGTAFANELMKASEQLYGYRWVFVMPHTPQANGLAEAAVKKLKIILDRHTNEYANWLPIVPMAQLCVNQRITSGMSSPFASVFGVAPTTLAALENPELLPRTTAAQREVHETAVKMAHLHQRLKREIDAVKAATALADGTRVPRRHVQRNDRIWLTYSDSERARYLRKHGHGRAWRHAFRVLAVKPHAVKLEVPRDGSVPEVLPWQSLRKCAFAAPYFHDPDLLLPDVNESGLPMMPETQTAGGPPVTPVASASWDPAQRFEIEDIVGATRVGGGWQLQVKWKGYPDATKEPLWRVTSSTKHPDILSAIKRCQDDYNTSHPSAHVPSNDANGNEAVGVIAILSAARRRDAVFADQATCETVGHFFWNDSEAAAVIAIQGAARRRDVAPIDQTVCETISHFDVLT